MPDNGTIPDADLAVCRDLMRQGSKTFFAAAQLLPPAVRQSALALYAFCRLADDVIDTEGRGEAGLAELRQRLRCAYAGEPWSLPVDRALSRVVHRHAIPIELLDALLEGFAWDAAGRRYESLSDVVAYAARVAGSVGAMMTLLLGERAPDVVARACDLGVAMQLSNIARDVGEDARAGRLYLPADWLRDEGVDPDAWLAAPVNTPAIASVIARLLAYADGLYDRAGTGIARLPLGTRAGIYAARLLYAEIGAELSRRGLDSIRQRTVVPAYRKVWLVSRALVAAPFLSARDQSPPLPEVQFLIDAVTARALDAVAAPPSWWQVEDRLVWVLDLFARLEREQQVAAQRSGA